MNSLRPSPPPSTTTSTTRPSGSSCPPRIRARSATVLCAPLCPLNNNHSSSLLFSGNSAKSVLPAGRVDGRGISSWWWLWGVRTHRPPLPKLPKAARLAPSPPPLGTLPSTMAASPCFGLEDYWSCQTRGPGQEAGPGGGTRVCLVDAWSPGGVTGTRGYASPPSNPGPCAFVRISWDFPCH